MDFNKQGIELYLHQLDELDLPALKEFIAFAKEYTDDILPKEYADAALREAYDRYATKVFVDKIITLAPDKAPAASKKKASKKATAAA